MSRFVIRAVPSGVKFDLKAGNGQGILTSEVYSSAAACRKGIASVIRSASRARIEDLTREEHASMPHPKFELYLDKAGEYRFRLKARNGAIIAISDGYAAKAGCLSGIESVQRGVSAAEITEE